MGQNSNIEWTDHTFNPWVGCVKVSDGCKNCYAETFMTRKERWAKTWGPAETTERLKTKTWNEPFKWNTAAREIGNRARVFCASLADVFEDNDALIDWRLELFETVIAKTPWLDWQILTKRPRTARQFFSLRQDLLFDNVWIGTSVENQKTADERIPELLKIPATIRFLSIEPLLGPINLLGNPERELWPMAEVIARGQCFEWVIVGGESGPSARPMHPDWVRQIRDDCRAVGIPFFFKQWGAWLPNAQEYGCYQPGANYNAHHQMMGDVAMAKVGKKAAGRLLDNRTWDEMPERIQLIEMANERYEN